MLLGAVGSAIAAEGPVTKGMVVVPVKGSETYKVIYKGASTGKVTLNIYDASSDRIFTQTFNGVDGFICPVNFSGVDAGAYTIELVDAEGKQMQTIRHGAHSARETAAHVNKLQGQEDRYLLSFVSNEAADVTVRIFDGSDRLIFEETRPTNGQFAKIYTLAADFDKVRFEIRDTKGKIKSITF